MSSDWKDFCQMHGGYVNDPEFLDKWLEQSQTSVNEKDANNYDLSVDEFNQIEKYIFIFTSCSFSEHWQVNSYITANSLWHEFPAIRSFNDYGENRDIRGILPRYFSLVCKILEIDGGHGSLLTRSQGY